MERRELIAVARPCRAISIRACGEYTTFGRNEPSLIDMHRTFRKMAGLPLVDEPAPE